MPAWSGSSRDAEAHHFPSDPRRYIPQVSVLRKREAGVKRSLVAPVQVSSLVERDRWAAPSTGVPMYLVKQRLQQAIVPDCVSAHRIGVDIGHVENVAVRGYGDSLRPWCSQRLWARQHLEGSVRADTVCPDFIAV